MVSAGSFAVDSAGVATASAAIDKSACVAGTYSNAAASQCSTAPAGRFASNSDNTAADVGAVSHYM